MFTIIWSTHHLEIDGWSWPLVFKDISWLFETFQLGREVEVKKPPYRNYITWLQQQDLGRLRRFGGNSQGVHHTHPFHSRDRRDRPIRDTHFGEISPPIREDLAALQSLARQNQVTLSTLFQGLGRYS